MLAWFAICRHNDICWDYNDILEYNDRLLELQSQFASISEGIQSFLLPDPNSKVMKRWILRTLKSDMTMEIARAMSWKFTLEKVLLEAIKSTFPYHLQTLRLMLIFQD